MAYATTKFAVVGLSTSLREEARGLGVNVSVVCPGFIQTGIFDAAEMINVSQEEAMTGLSPPTKMMSPADCAKVILKGVARNKAIIPVTRLTHITWRLYRLVPTLTMLLTRRMVTSLRKARREHP